LSLGESVRPHPFLPGFDEAFAQDAQWNRNERIEIDRHAVGRQVFMQNRPLKRDAQAEGYLMMQIKSTQ
jgi:hypothetical protein